MYDENRADQELIQNFVPEISGESTIWRYWRTIVDGKHCIECFNNHGRIFDIHTRPPLHERCRCDTFPLSTIRAGTASIHKQAGADYSLHHFDELPRGYVSKEYAKGMGWKRKQGNLWAVLPGKYIGGSIYKNKDKKLPIENGRIWYEADINYVGGYRGNARVLYSNDGFLFVTYDHYGTFYEII